MLESEAFSDATQTTGTAGARPAAHQPKHEMKEPFFNKRKTLAALGPESLPAVFARLETLDGIHLDIPADANESHVLKAIAKLDDTKEATVNALLQNLNVIHASGRRTARPIAATMEKNDIKPPKRFEFMTPIQKAAWLYANASKEAWKEMCSRVRLVRYTLRDWLKVVVKTADTYQPDHSQPAIDAMRDCVCAVVSEIEARGQHGDVELIDDEDRRGRRTYYLMRLNDNVLVKPQWKGGNKFDDLPVKDAFRIVFMYDWSRHEVHVCYDGVDAKTRQLLCEIWAKSMLGKGATVERMKDSYNIQQFRDSTYGNNLAFPPGSPLTEAHVVYLGIFRAKNRKRLRVYKETNDLYGQLDKDLKNGSNQLHDDLVSKVTIRLKVLVEEEEDPIPLMLNLSQTSSNYQSFDADIVPDIEDFLRENGIIGDCAESAKNTGESSHG